MNQSTTKERINTLRLALRLGDIQIKVHHFRIPGNEKGDGPPNTLKLVPTMVITEFLKQPVNPRGGCTVVTLQKDNLVGVGEALCSMSDNFVKAEGELLAMERAIIALNLAEQARSAYFSERE